MAEGADYTISPDNIHLESSLPMNLPERDITIDLAKGFAIFLVVLGHAIQYSFGPEWTSSQAFFENGLFKAIYSFHMPLFMLISGYLFYGSNKKDFKDLVVSKLKGIGIPMVSFVLICNGPAILRYWARFDFLHSLTFLVSRVFYGMTMWFLLSLLMNMLIVALITRVFKRRFHIYVAFALVFIASLFIPDSIILSVHKFMFPFFCIGYIVKENAVDVYKYSKNVFFMGVLTVLSVLCILWFDRDTYIYTTGFSIKGKGIGQLFIDCKRTLIGLVVSFTVLQYVHLFAEHCRANLFVHLGQISLFIYGTNMVIDTFYKVLLSKMGVSIGFNYIAPALFTMGVILLAVLVYNVISKNKVTRLLFLGK